MKIGILTYHRAYNYGAYLQAVALQNRLDKEPDIEAEIIDFRMDLERKKYDINEFSIKRKAKMLLKGQYFQYKALCSEFEKAQSDPLIKKSKETLTSNSMDDFAKFVKGKYDVIVCGSDEIWRVSAFRGFPTPYWLIGDLGSKKYAYAVSARVDFSSVLRSEELETARRAIRDFSYISVRDISTKEEVDTLGGSRISANLMPDPSFLFDFDTESVSVTPKLEKNRKYSREKKTILVMINSLQVAKKIHKDLSRNYNLVSVFHFFRGFINMPNISPREWLKLIKDSDFVITSFFHAACFSIVYNKQFIAIGTDSGKSGKLEELCRNCTLRDRYMLPEQIDSFATIMHHSFIADDYSGVVNQYRMEFEGFIEALKS